MDMYFSASVIGFFDAADRVAYEAGLGWPQDAVPLTEDEYAAAINPPQGMRLSAGQDGKPVFTAIDMTPQLPTQCTPAQGLVALFALKRITEDNLLEAIHSIPDDIQRYTAKIGYQRATSWERTSPTMQTMAQLLQLTESDLDELFTHAAGVNL